MRIALCIGNLAATGRHGAAAYELGYKHLNKNIISKYNNVDIFLHSYEPELKNILHKIYNPVYSIFENRHDFSEYANKLDPFIASQSIQNYETIFSMFYSRFVVGDLKKKYELKHNFKYDWVIFARYDLTSAFHIVDLPFNAELDNNFLYSAMFDQINAGPMDQWFYGNSSDMDQLFSLYLNLNEYFQYDSEYINASKNWFDSNKNDRFSCEIFKKQKCDEPEALPYNTLINAHYLYKWHLYKNGMWNLNKLKFTLTPHLLTDYYRLMPLIDILKTHKNIVSFLE